MFGTRDSAMGYQTMNDEDDQYDISPSSRNDGTPVPSAGPGDSEGANNPADGDVESGKPQEKWNSESDDGDEVMDEEVVEDDDGSFEEEIVDDEDEEAGSSSYFTEEVDEGTGAATATAAATAAGGGSFPDAAPVAGDDPRDLQGFKAQSVSFDDQALTSKTKAPSPPEAEPEQAPGPAGADQAVPPPKGLMSQRARAVEEAQEDKFLSSWNGLVCMGILIFLMLAAIVLGTGLGLSKPWETDDESTSTGSSSPTEFPSFSPVSVSPEDAKVLTLLESVVGDVVFEEGTPYNEAAHWMLYRDPSRATRRWYSRRELQTGDTSYTDEELDYIQRYLLVFLWYATTNNGQEAWLSCNPVRPTYTEEDCEYQKAIRKLPSGEIQYENIPWTRWLSGAEECDWAGVTCASTSSGRLAVTAIDLGGQGLAAPMDYIIEMMKLPEIKTLAFAYNDITGKLDSSLETLDMLDLTYNFLTGPLILLGGLTSLILEGNQFTGTLPTELFEFTTPLQLLNVGGNKLTGGIPPEASFALKLTSLDLHDNALEGTIPPELGQLPLVSLRLQGNNFNGPIPVDQINVNWLTTLEELWLFDNDLTGEIPQVLGNATRMLDLRLSGNNLVGGIPADLYNLVRLFRLELASNQLSGRLSASLVTQLTQLEELDLSGNVFSGQILLDSGLASLQSLHLEFNEFTGPVPDSLCSIASLDTLSADCYPTTDPPNPCSCCTACCSRDTQECFGSDGSPIAAPTEAPTKAPIVAPTATPTEAPIAAPTEAPIEAPTEAPASSPSSSSIDSVEQWARDTFGEEIDQSDGSPHSLTSLWIAQGDSLGVSLEDTTFLQRYVLAFFYYSTRTWLSCNPASTTSCLYQEYVQNTDGTFSYVPTPATRWLASVSECEWVGVLCSSGVVNGINLFGQEISGELPTELVALPSLQTIKLAYNSLSGTIPLAYGNITQLSQFEVQVNSLTGAMPPEICQLPLLESLAADCEEVTCECCSTCCSNDICPVV